MSEQELLFSFLIGLMIVALGAMILSRLQWQRVNREARTLAAMKRLRGKAQPTVTVLVYAHNQQDHITSTLRTLKNSRYRKFDVVVVDDASTDGTNEVVRAFMNTFPKAPIQLLRRRQRTSVDQALKAGYRKSKKGQIVLTIHPELPIDTLYVKRAVASQGDRTTWRVTAPRSLSSTLRITDIGSFLNDYVWQQESKGCAYEATWFKRHTPSTGEVRPALLVARGVSIVVLLVGILTAAFFTIGVQVLWYSWVIVTAYGLAAIWLRYGAPLRDRLVLTLSIPLALFLIPVTSAVRGISQLTSRK